jgi:hypothetical protein
MVLMPSTERRIGQSLSGPSYADVHEDDIGAELMGDREGLPPVGCFTNDLDAVPGGRFGFVPVDERSGYDHRHPVP